MYSDPYYYDYSVSTGSEVASMGAGIIIIFLLVVLFVLLAVAVVSYIITSYSLYKIARKRGIANPWMSWVPVLSNYTIGKITDEYDGRNGFRRKWGATLLTLALISFFSGIVTIGLYVKMCGILIQAAAYGEYMAAYMVTDLIGTMIAFYGVAVIASIASSALMVCQYICIYKIYESAVGQKALKYFLLTLFVPFANLVCISICANRVQEIYPVQLAQPVQPEEPEQPETEL